MLLAKVKRTIDRFGMLKPGERVLVAVSGGPDSVCLLSALRALSDELLVSLHIAHLDHMFRGRESAEEALFVAGLAKKLNIAATIEKIDVPAFCRERGLSAQTGAREVRYGFLNRVAEKVGAARIATGHTATDQAETFLMRLMRGAGVSGLSAIPPKRENIIRPLIEVTREEVLEYLQSSGFEYVSDPSNAKPVYTRNRIRLEVLPVLKQFNPRIVETLAAEAALFRDEDEALEACLAAIAAGVITQEEDGVVLQREKFNALPQAFRRRLLRNAANRASAESSGLSSIQIDEALAFMAAARTGRIMLLPYGLVIEREYEKFIIHLLAAAEGFSHTLALPGVTAIPELGMQVETMIVEGTAAEQEDKNYFWQALFDYDKIGPLLTLRSRRPGDWFRPAGMGGGSKKLQDYFVDAKVPRRKRDTVPLLAAGDDILWVAGLRTDERFLPRADTKKILVIRMRKAVGPEPETAP
jgi:tRNA(Ile)-lysidine synthase